MVARKGPFTLIFTAWGVFVMESIATAKKTQHKLQNHLFKFLLSLLKKKTTDSFFASAGSSLLVMHNLDQTIKIIYKAPAIEETIAEREQLFFPSLLVSITPTEEFTARHFS